MDTKRAFTALVWLCLFAVSAGNSFARPELSEEDPLLQSGPDAPYRTPRSGEEVHARVFGRPVDIRERNRRLNSAWGIGLEYTPELDHDRLGLGYLYFWRHPDEMVLQRALISVLYNDLLWAQKKEPGGRLEFVIAFQNFTPLSAMAELVDGEMREEEELRWGYVRLGAGMGFREQVSPGKQDNMLALDLLLESGYLYFSKGQDTAADFLVPRDTPELRAHFQIRWDAVERNLLELPHQGAAAGGDLVAGIRSQWQDWGINGRERQGREFRYATGYIFVAAGVPGIGSERHRLIGSVHGGWGDDIDRFSAPRLGGGQNTIGEEYASTSEPVLPGAGRGEFYPRHYLVAFGEYRWEPAFFAYLGLNASVARVNRTRESGAELVNRTDTLTSAGCRLTSGFLFNSRIQIAYNYGFYIVRKGEYGAHELAVHITKPF